MKSFSLKEALLPRGLQNREVGDGFAGVTDNNLLGGRDALTLCVRCNDGKDNSA
jgi:hypothetical protein